MAHALRVVWLLVVSATAWTWAPPPARPLHGLARASIRTAAVGGADGEWVEVALPGRADDTVTFHRSELQLLQAAREELVRSEEHHTRTHVVFLLSPQHTANDFDATVGALTVLGMPSLVTGFPEKEWAQVDRRLKQAVKEDALCLDGSQKGRSSMLDKSVLGWVMHPFFELFEAASLHAAMPDCERLVLVGCEDASSVLQAFLSELARVGLAPEIPVVLVALASRKDSLLAKAVDIVCGEKLENVKYLSISGHAAKQPKRRATRAGTASAPLYVRSDAESISCFNWGDNDEECLLQAAEWDGETEAWFGQPTTLLNWIVRCL